MHRSEVTFVEVVVADLEPTVEVVTWWVTETVYLRAPADLDIDILCALIDAICQC